ncbi:MAG: glycine--tRNA ligase subunit alpha, partial [Pseudomonadota bacterium]
RLAMYVFGVENVYDLPFNAPDSPVPLTYGDVFLENERQQSAFNFEHSDVDMLRRWFEDCEAQSNLLRNAEKPLPAYDFALKASHVFNLIDARGAISPTERQAYIGRVRDLARGAAEQWAEQQSAS